MPDLAWFIELQQHQSSFIDSFFKNVNKHMLGPYYEALWRLFLHFSKHYQLQYHNVQINDDGKTVGELDFLIRRLQDSRLVHIEVAIKFYLHVPMLGQSDQLHAWLGPKCNDRFDFKVDKIRNKQSRLLELPATQRSLSNYYSPFELANALSHSVIQGRLYVPFASDDRESEALAFSSESAFWMSFSEFKRWFIAKQSMQDVYLVPKPHWLAFNPSVCQPLVSLEQIESCFRENRAQMHCYVYSKQGDGSWVYVVNDGWPLSEKKFQAMESL